MPSIIIKSVVSVIIISYNTRELTLKCLSHLYESRGVKLEIILVDNASTDDSVAAVKEKYPQIKLIVNKQNAGFGRANNQGMKIATGEYLLLLNSDCFVETDTISGLVKVFEALPEAAVAGCKLLNPDGSLQPSYGFFPNLFRIVMLLLFVDNLPVIRKYFPSIHVRDAGRYRRISEVDWVMGALMLVRRPVFEKTGGFDEKYFMYGEEVDWQYRIKKAGFCVKFVPQVSATHVGGASSPNKAPALLGEMRGWKHWFAKYYPGWQETALSIIVAVGCWLRIILKPEFARFYRQALKQI